MFRPLIQALKRGVATICSRRIYLVAMVAIPLLMAAFFASLLYEGLPTKIPGAVVDLDRTELSRDVIRSIKASQAVEVAAECENYDEAMALVRSGKVYGAYIIPHNFEHDVISGLDPTIEYYSDMTYFVPGTFIYRGYKTVSVVVTSGLVAAKASSAGLPPSITKPLMQPMVMDINPINNPTTNYSLYLSPSFFAGCLALMVFLVTIFSIAVEIKNNTSREWIQNAGGSIFVALIGKLLPQTVVFTIVSWGCLGILFGFSGFPIHCPLWVLPFATLLLITACQGFGVMLVSAIPNLRLGLSAGALLGILSISFCGFSFPIEKMYGAIAIMGYAMPVRWWFDIFITQVLNGYPLWFTRWAFVVLIMFPVVAVPLLGRLKKAMLNPVYIP